MTLDEIMYNIIHEHEIEFINRGMLGEESVLEMEDVKSCMKKSALKIAEQAVEEERENWEKAHYDVHAAMDCILSRIKKLTEEP
jgi:hypothetical protein